MTHDTDIKQEVLAKIRAGDISMHSSGYFAFRIGVFAFFSILAILCSILIFNFISFSIRFSGQDALLGFGTRGFFFFFKMFPWPLFILDIVFIVAAARALRYFRFGYRNPALVLLAALLLLTFALGLFMDRETPFNDRILVHAMHHDLGPLDDVYQNARRPGPPEGGVCRCTITAISPLGAVVAQNPYASTTPLSLVLPPGFATSTLHVGETLFIAGDREGDMIVVFGLHQMAAEADELGMPGPDALAPMH